LVKLVKVVKSTKAPCNTVENELLAPRSTRLDLDRFEAGKWTLSDD
jgi:hypothetical protein